MKLEQLRVEIANINDKCKSSSELKTPLQEINLRNEEL